MNKLPSLQLDWVGKGEERRKIKPRIQVLEVGRKSGDPIHLLVERTENYEQVDDQVVEASIELKYQIIENTLDIHHVEGGEFSGSYRRYLGTASESVRLTSSSAGSSGFVVVDPSWLEGHRVGTYLMNEVVNWAKQWPVANVRKIELLEGQASQDNLTRRNRFYEQFGIEFDYEDSKHRAGVSKPVKVAGLNTINGWQKNVKEIPLEKFLAQLKHQNQMLGFELRARARDNAQMQKEWEFAVTKPLRWAWVRLWSRLFYLLRYGA
ncbi:GNAT family N-acetyltransferase [Halomonas sp. E19]|uniref:GNAT family N-acetyltransferase n=1 Tax=Halomonas sp. E19 TaxID=3397247 RepID=UPI0040338C90